MRPVTVAVVGVGVSPVIPIDIYLDPTNIGIGVIVSPAATVTYVVQYTFDDIWAVGFDPASANWFNHPTLTGAASANGNLMAPPRGVRLSVSVSDGTVTMYLVQAGATG